MKSNKTELKTKLKETHRYTHPNRWYMNIWYKDKNGNVFVKVVK